MGLIDDFEDISIVEAGTLHEKLANLPAEIIVKKLGLELLRQTQNF